MCVCLVSLLFCLHVFLPYSPPPPFHLLPPSLGKSAGLVMSIALTIEMGFLGLTFSAGVSKVGR